MKTLFSKIFFSFLTVILIFSTLNYFFTFKEFEETNTQKLKKELENFADLISYQFKDKMKEMSYVEIDSIVNSIETSTEFRITIIRSDGIVIADTDKRFKEMDNHFLRPEVQQSLTQKYGSSIRYSLTVKSNLMYVSRLINLGDESSGFVRVSFWLKDIETTLERFQNDYLLIVLYIFLFSTLISYVLSINLTKPIKYLSEFTNSFSIENFKIRIKSTSKDEIGDLTNNFNLMAKNIEELFDKLNNERESLSTIINNMAEGLMVFNEKDIIVLANKKLKEILNFEDLEGKFVWETVKSKEFVDFISTLKTDRTYKRIEFNIEQMIYLVSFSYLESKNEIICIFYDVTEQKRLEEQKRDFVTNVSHELRTPLTSIQGFVETLQEEEKDEDKSHYLSIIHRNTIRLINLVKDLMILSKVEGRNNKEDYENLDINEVISSVLKLYQNTQSEKNIEIVSNLSSAPAKVFGDLFRLEQVFINLIDNAIKYSDQGIIEIKTELLNSSVIITIKDNGIGIPEDKINRIFERFYVVDKSRSRLSGGTGLGLSLVKHIIQNHKGKISVKSLVGKGTEFTITLKTLS